MDAAFEAERARGHTIGAHQAPESAERLDAAVRTAFQRYLAQGHADWRQLARFCDEHYVRHLVEESANCEMIVSGAGGRSTCCRAVLRSGSWGRKYRRKCWYGGWHASKQEQVVQGGCGQQRAPGRSTAR